MLKLLLIPLLCIASWAHAQQNYYDENQLLSQIRFSGMPALYNNLDYQNIGAPLFKSRVGLGGEFVVSYGQEFWKGFGLNVGAGIGFVPYNFSFDLVTDTSSILADNPGLSGQFPNRNTQFLLTFPILIEKKFLLSREEKLFLNLEAGIKWNIKTSGFGTSGGSYGTRTDGGEDVTYFEYRFFFGEPTEFISYVFKAGLFKMNRRDNSFSWNLVLQQSFATMLNGTYQFNELGFESHGTTQLYNSYVGLELIYGLSLGRHSRTR